MAQLLLRQLDLAVKEALRRRAQRHGRSMEEEVRVILGPGLGRHGSVWARWSSSVSVRLPCPRRLGSLSPKPLVPLLARVPGAASPT